jgi:hypothetical protein
VGPTGPIGIGSTGATGASGQSLLIPGPRFYVPGENTPAILKDWHDLSGHGNDGTLYDFSGDISSGWAGSGTFPAPFILVLDGAGYNYVDCGVGVSAAFNADFTLELRLVIPLGGSATYQCIASAFNNGTLGVDLGINTGAPKLYMRGTGAYPIAFSTDLRDSTMHHLLYSVTPSGAIAYLDNVVEATVSGQSWAPINAWNSFQLGRRPDSGTYPLTGSICVVRLYPFALNPTQVAQNFAAGPQASAGVWGDGVTPGAVLELVAAYGNAFVGG